MSDNRGVALVLALMAVALISALGLSLSVLTSVEMRIASNFSEAQEARSAADSALEIAVQELWRIADWGTVAGGGVRSAFVDGRPDGTRQLSDGSSLNLAELTGNLGETGWQLFAYGPLSSIAALPSSIYIVAWARSDPSGREGIMELRADAFGPAGTRRSVQATVSRTAVLSWSSR